MRILSIITSFTAGGAETLVSNLCRQFVGNGHEAIVAALSDAATLGNSLASEKAMRGRLAKGGVETMSLALSHRRNILAGMLAMRRIVAAAKPDIIHAHTAQAALILAASRPGIPVVMTHHNSRLSFPAPLFRIFDTVVSQYVGISIECSAMITRLSRRPVETIINAADSLFRVDEARTSPASPSIIISVGAPSPQKDFATLIRAAPRLRRLMESAGRSCAIQIVGDSPRIKMLQKLAAREGVSDMVTMMGARDDVDRLLAAADLYVNCSRYEGLSVAIIEAMMSGLPVVATNVAGNRELIHPDINGILSPVGNPAALADAIAAVLLDADRYAALSRGAMAEAKPFTIEGAARAHLQLYESILLSARPSLRQAA